MDNVSGVGEPNLKINYYFCLSPNKPFRSIIKNKISVYFFCSKKEKWRLIKKTPARRILK